MSVRLYTDVHVHRAIVDALRARGVSVITAREDDHDEAADAILLDRATSLIAAVFTNDDDFLREATERQRAGRSFAGVVYAHPLRVSIGQCVRDLELIAVAAHPEELTDRIIYLPLR